jgi:hypothetical protein
MLSAEPDVQGHLAPCPQIWGWSTCWRRPWGGAAAGGKGEGVTGCDYFVITNGDNLYHRECTAW